MKRNIFYTCVAIVCFTLSSYAHKTPSHCAGADASMTAIKSYLSSVAHDSQGQSAEIYVGFLVMENEALYSVDFMLDEKGKVIILSKEFEKEYYKVQNYSTQKLKKYSSAVALIV